MIYEDLAFRSIRVSVLYDSLHYSGMSLDIYWNIITKINLSRRSCAYNYLDPYRDITYDFL